MTLKQALGQAREMLAANNIEDAPLESELLLRHTLNLDRIQLYQDLDHELNPQQEHTFWELIKRRLNHEPTAYIIRQREFYGLDFYVDPNVLIPRPESELLVDMALRIAQDYEVATIADIGTGCGAIAVSLALHLPPTRIYATDVSAAALEVTLINCQKHNVAHRIRRLQGDLLNPLPEPVDLIIANLPYVKQTELLESSITFEPILALNGGPDGLQKIRQLCYQVNKKLNPTGHLLLEIGLGQGKTVTAWLRRIFPHAKIEITPDLSGIERVVSLSLVTDH